MHLRHIPATLALTLLVSGPASACAQPATPGPSPRVADADAGAAEAEVTSVLAISIDGLNPRALRVLGRSGTPHLHRFARQGASTLNARTEYEMTKTLPNHTGMVTGRRIVAAQGGHGVDWNDDRRRPATVQEAAGRPVESVFTEVTAAGGSTAVFASKTKFSLWQRSWPESLDRTQITEHNGRLVTQLVDDLDHAERDFRFLHLSLPDAAGHDHGFMSRPYLRAVRRVDALVGRAVAAVRDDPERRATTAIVLTSDHGGQGRGHRVAGRIANHRVPFMVIGPGVTPGVDLYDLNPDYRDPGRSRPTYDAERQPVRNGALANLALDLLGLGPVPGSEHAVGQDLDVS